MWFKYFTLILLFCLIAILQSSIMIYFSILGFIPNIIFILFLVIIFFEEKNEYDLGFWSLVIAGFFMDILLPYFFGISLITLLIIYILEKFALHFLKEGSSRFTIFYFIPMFIGCFMIYNAILYLISLIFNFNISFQINSLIISSIYNLIFACIIFYTYKF